MREITPYLFATEKDKLGFFKKTRINAFLLVRENGENFVLYNSTHLEFDEFFLHEKGGVSRQYLSNVSEANDTCAWLQATFENLTYCHDIDEIKVVQYCNVNGTFTGNVKLGHDFEIIPTPGNTPGSTCFYWVAPDGKRIMFTGDTLVPDDRGEWMLFIEDQTPENEEIMLQNLQKLYEYDVDYVVPQMSEGEVEWLKNEREEWHTIVDRAIVRLRTKLMHISKKI